MVRLTTLNIDWEKNLSRVLPFLEASQTEIACLQEVRDCDMPLLQKAFNGESLFVPMTRSSTNGSAYMVGLGIFSRLRLRIDQVDYYVGDPDLVCELDETSVESRRETTRRMLVVFEVQKGVETFRIATTHFTWTPDGKPDAYQRQDLKTLFALLDSAGELVLCGDFNAPRGGEIFSALASRFKDNVPLNFTTTIDSKYHKNKKLSLVVDGIFSTLGYRVSNTTITFGLSDHCALSADLYKR